MSRIVLDVTPEQHRWLKSLASLKGISMKKFALSKIFESEKTPNTETIKAMEDADNYHNLTTCEDLDDLFSKLEA